LRFHFFCFAFHSRYSFSGGLPFDIFTATDTAHTGQPQRPDFNSNGVPAAVGNPLMQTGPNRVKASFLRAA
jgi:hypothetical protein